MSITASIKSFLARPLVKNAEHHFVTAFGATFVVAVLPVVQDITSGKSINVSATEALVISAFVGGVSAGLRAAGPSLLKLAKSILP